MLALKNYSEALALDPEDALVYSNRSAVFCGLNRFDQALDDAEVAIKLKPNWAKVNYFHSSNMSVLLEKSLCCCMHRKRNGNAFSQAHARKGAALSRMDQHEAALMAYMEAFYLEPSNNDYKEYAKIERKLCMGKI